MTAVFDSRCEGEEEDVSRKTWLDYDGPNSTGNESKKTKKKHNTRGSRRSCLNGPRLTPPEGLRSTEHEAYHLFPTTNFPRMRPPVCDARNDLILGEMK